MIKRISRQAYQLLLASLLIGAIFVSFQVRPLSLKLSRKNQFLTEVVVLSAAVAVAPNSVRIAKRVAILVGCHPNYYMAFFAAQTPQLDFFKYSDSLNVGARNAQPISYWTQPWSRR